MQRFKGKIKIIGGNKKGLNKETSNILNNIELISFIDEDKVESYKKFIIDNLKKKMIINIL